ncbi:hypothetical protein K438DRAFT_621858 [Mycena galopus ATCC 62051]|nr:hypothetical protein K438DRAFT_621858 [Mycena galopus ATCC 62051]
MRNLKKKEESTINMRSAQQRTRRINMIAVEREKNQHRSLRIDVSKGLRNANNCNLNTRRWSQSMWKVKIERGTRACPTVPTKYASSPAVPSGSAYERDVSDISLEMKKKKFTRKFLDLPVKLTCTEVSAAYHWTHTSSTVTTPYTSSPAGASRSACDIMHISPKLNQIADALPETKISFKFPSISSFRSDCSPMVGSSSRNNTSVLARLAR